MGFGAALYGHAELGALIPHAEAAMQRLHDSSDDPRGSANRAAVEKSLDARKLLMMTVATTTVPLAAKAEGAEEVLGAGG